MAAGRAIAAVDVGDIKAMVAPDNRPYVVSKNGSGDLSRALQALLASAELRATLGRENRRRALEDFSQDRMFQAYQTLLDGQGGAL